MQFLYKKEEVIIKYSLLERIKIFFTGHQKFTGYRINKLCNHLMQTAVTIHKETDAWKRKHESYPGEKI